MFAVSGDSPIVSQVEIRAICPYWTVEGRIATNYLAIFVSLYMAANLGALTILGLALQAARLGWVSLDVLGRLDVLWRIVESMGGSPALIVSIISSWQFGFALIVAGLTYTIFVGEPKAGVQRHPALPYIAGSVFAVCVTLLASFAIYGEYELQLRKAYAAGASGIPRDTSPAKPQKR
jgi:hypothetical protein